MAGDGAERARLFVAVWVPRDAVGVLQALPRPSLAGLRWTGPEQWHVTLRFLGTTEVEPVRHALAGAPWPGPTPAIMGPETSRFGQRVLHVPVAGLEGLAAVVVDATAGLGRPPEARAFHGHLTLARAGDRRGRGGRVDLRPLCGQAAAWNWTVDEVTLVASHLHPTGARYEVVDRFSL